MGEITLESLVKRVEALERALLARTDSPGKDDWLRVVGMFGDSEFAKQMDEEGRKIREAERAEARRELADEMDCSVPTHTLAPRDDTGTSLDSAE